MSLALLAYLSRGKIIIINLSAQSTPSTAASAAYLRLHPQKCSQNGPRVPGSPWATPARILLAPLSVLEPPQQQHCLHSVSSMSAVAATASCASVCYLTRQPLIYTRTVSSDLLGGVGPGDKRRDEGGERRAICKQVQSAVCQSLLVNLSSYHVCRATSARE